MKVVIIGTGNAATILGTKIMLAGHTITQVIGRDFEKTNILASHLFSTAVYNIRYINLLEDIYLIAVSDSAISSVASFLKLNSKIVVHTAAAISKNVLVHSSDNHGVIYPLQTLKKEVKTIPPIPVLIDASNESTIASLKEFSLQWADSVVVANDEERLKLHVAAVFVNNFTNHLFSVAEKYCEQEKLNFRLLLPLIEETVQTIHSNHPSKVQTGPAVRNDELTIAKHRHILFPYPDYLSLYNELTSSIIEHSVQNNASEV